MAVGITSLDELLASDVMYGGIANGATMNHMRSQTEEPFSEMWATIDSSSETRVESTEEGVERALNGTYAFIMEDQLANYYAPSRACRSAIQRRATYHGN